MRLGRGKCKAGGQQAGCQGWPGSSWGVDHRGLERIVGVKAQAWQCSVGTACPSIGPGNRRGGVEGGGSLGCCSLALDSAGLSHLGWLAILTGRVSLLLTPWWLLAHFSLFLVNQSLMGDPHSPRVERTLTCYIPPYALFAHTQWSP